jgi:monovalent cation:H+ antiporter-2, CPA2 family
LDELIFQQFLTIFGFSLLGAMLFQRLKMATIVSYIAVGVVIGPSALGLIDDPSRFDFLAEFGVVFLLFSLGLEFSLSKMLRLKFAIFGVGGVQVLTCTAVFALAVYLWGASLNAAIMIGGALALSSTAIVTRELLNNRELHSLHGQLSVGVLLFQDLIAVVFLILVPVLGTGANAEPGANTSLAAALTQAALYSLLLSALLLAAGHYILPLIYREVAKSQSDEIFMLTTLVIVLLAAWLTHSFHLSMALGGFVIGMMLGEGPFKYQIENDVKPFKNILLGLFFVTIGMLIDLSLFVEYWPRILLFTVSLILIKVIVVAGVVKLLGHSASDALSVGLTLGQAGEFGLALMALALLNGIVPPDQSSFIILIAIFSMVASPFLIRHASQLGERVFGDHNRGQFQSANELHLSDHVIIGGYGRLGSTIAGFLEQTDTAYIVIDHNVALVEKARQAGVNIVYGDSNNPDILALCQLGDARLVVLTFKSVKEGQAAIAGVRQRNKDIPIIVRCHTHEGYEELMSLGANKVIPELLESSLIISRHVLELLDVQSNEIEALIEAHRDQLLM